MSELRWTLLILGVVFIAALSWWERRRPRQAFAPHLREASVEPAAGEPWIGEESLSDVVSSDRALGNAAQAREPDFESDADESVEPTAPGPLEALPTVLLADAGDRLELAAAWDDLPSEPRLIDPEASEPMDASEPMEAAATAAPTPPPAVSPAAGPIAPAVSAVPGEPEIAGAEGVGAVRIVEPAAAPPIEVIVDWPPEESRRILALRLVAPHAERFPGRALRLALAAEGFLLGRFSIFHKPDATNHALLSAASLTRPGSFDLETMDSQRYGGLSLFVVLPGPRTPQHAFEELFTAARNLNERMEGALQDERGNPLTALRVQAIRESLRAQAAPPPPAAAHGA